MLKYAAMKVKDLMQKNVVFVSPNTSLYEVSKIIFGRDINGVPVCQGKKLVGFITERDILAQFYPTMGEFVQDYVHAKDFEGMEEKAKEILEYPVEKIMSKDPAKITIDVPLLKAQSLMQVHKVGRLPVVDNKGNLIGILSKRDIFEAIIGEKVPLEQEEGFYDWIATYYDVLIDWDKRLENEMKDFVKLFNKEGVKKIIDVAFGTGEHSLALVKKGFEVLGLESSSAMRKISERKKKGFGKRLQDKVHFVNGVYDDLLKKSDKDFDAAIFMGNVLPYVLITDKDLLGKVSEALNPEKSVMVFQFINFQKLLKEKNGFEEFNIKGESSFKQKHAFLGFYSKKNNVLTSTHAFFDQIGDRWGFKGINSTTVKEINPKDLEGMLKGMGFSKVELYGNSFGEPLFKKPFKPDESDWLIVVAKR